MTTPITKEQLIARIETQKETALKHPECSVALMDLEIANIAKAAMDAEPVGEVLEQPDGLVMDGTVHLGGSRTHRVIKGLNKMSRAKMEHILEYAKQKRHTGQPCKVPSTEMVEIVEMAMLHGKADGALTNEGTMPTELVMLPYKLPERVTNALTLSLQAMEFMGDTLNNLDAVCTEDVEFIAPAFEAVRAVLAGAFRENDNSSTKIFREIAETSTNSPAIPDGWQLVPINAFPSQWAAGQRAFNSAGINKVDAIYKAMIAAAPELRKR